MFKVENIKIRKEANKHHLTSATSWKVAVNFMLEYGDIKISNRSVNGPMETNNDDIEKMLAHFPNFYQFAKKLDYLSLPMPEIFLQLNLNMSDEAAKYRRAHLVIGQLMGRLEKLKYVDVSNIDMGINEYSLNEKGISVALKLQEHEDNKKRFKQTRNIMIFSAFAGLAIALFSGLRFYYEQHPNNLGKWNGSTLGELERRLG